MPFEVLIPDEAIQARVKELGRQITADYEGKTVHLVGVLKGAYTFLADLARHIDLPVTIDFLAVSSYGKGTRTSGEVRLTKDLDQSLEGKEVIVIEDIADTGLTLNYLVNLLRSRRPASLKVCAFLSKPSRRQIGIAVDYVGFEIPDRFVVGYGLDLDQLYRNLRDVSVMEEIPAATEPGTRGRESGS